MSSPNDLSEHQVQELLKLATDGDENAYHSLLAASHNVLSPLIARYQRENSPEIRAMIVEVVWQHRRAQDLPFLALAVNDEAPGVWKQALDGLATLGGESAKSQLEGLLRDQASDNAKAAWIREAITQIQEADDGGVR